MGLREWFESWWPWAVIANLRAACKQHYNDYLHEMKLCRESAVREELLESAVERQELAARIAESNEAAARRALAILLKLATAVRRGDVDARMLPSALDGIVESDPLYLEASDHYGQIREALSQMEHAENWLHPHVDLPGADGKRRTVQLQMPMWAPAAADVGAPHPATIASWILKFFPDPVSYRAQALKAQGVAGIGHLKPGMIHKTCLGSVSRKLGEYWCTKCGRIVMEDEVRTDAAPAV